MLAELNGISEAELVQWIESHAADRSALHGQGYQGKVYLYEANKTRLVIKAASGAGPLRWLRRKMLRHEYRVYAKLEGCRGVAGCIGFLRGRYLILKYIDGTPVRHARIQDRAVFFDRLLETIKEMHRRGVAHSDLKRKDNLLVIDGDTPCVIDFGTAVIYKPGFAPLNHFLYRVARQFDLNAWVKLKYDGRYEDISPGDRAYFKRTRIEKAARWIKQRYLNLKRRLRKV